MESNSKSEKFQITKIINLASTCLWWHPRLAATQSIGTTVKSNFSIFEILSPEVIGACDVAKHPQI